MAGNKKTQKSTKTKGGKAGSDAAAESTIQSIKSLPAEQQFDALVSRYTELASEHSQAKNSLASITTRCEAAEKSKDQLNSDYTKAMLSKAQLESLCRELQKQNKLTKEENLARIREEEVKRRDVSNRLNSTLADITGLMQQNTEKNNELRKENQNMAAKLNELVAQYEGRQQNIDKLLKQKELQLQLADAKLKKAEIEAAEEREKYLRDKKTLLEEMQVLQGRLTRMASTEIGLRQQLEKYTSNYDEFQRTVDASNAIMNKFKKEMELMNKKVKKLEKETLQWQLKFRKSEKTLIEMSSERLEMKADIDKLTRQNVKLQNLARALADQRKKPLDESTAEDEISLELKDNSATDLDKENNESTEGSRGEDQVSAENEENPSGGVAGNNDGMLDELTTMTSQLTDIKAKLAELTVSEDPKDDTTITAPEVKQTTTEVEQTTTEVEQTTTEVEQSTTEVEQTTTEVEQSTTEVTTKEATIEITEL